jgi:hypothetical protein
MINTLATILRQAAFAVTCAPVSSFPCATKDCTHVAKQDTRAYDDCDAHGPTQAELNVAQAEHNVTQVESTF